MNDELISFETAKLAKKKGFDIETKCDFTCDLNDSDIQEGFAAYLCNPISPRIRYYRPTQSLLQRWLRDKHDTDIFIARGGVRDQWYLSGTRRFNYGFIFYEGRFSNPFKTYEQALEQGLQEALKLI